MPRRNSNLVGVTRRVTPEELGEYATSAYTRMLLARRRLRQAFLSGDRYLPGYWIAEYRWWQEVNRDRFVQVLFGRSA